MVTDKIRKYVLPNIPYLFIGWFCLKIGTAYRLAAGAGFGEKLLGLGQTIGAAFASFAPGGYVFNNGGSFVERYHGMENIPPEHRIFAYPKLNIREQMAAYQEVIDRSALNEEKLRLPTSREDR